LRALFVLLSLLLFTSFCVQALVTVSSADFTVKVANNNARPQWIFQQNDNLTYVYTVTLVSMWETENSTSFDFVAGSNWYPLGWPGNATLGNVVNNSRQIAYATEDGMNPGRFDTFSVNTQVPLWAVNGSDYPAGKFNVEITNYEWVSPSDTAQLNVAFLVEYSVDGAVPNQLYNTSTHGSRTIDFGGAYLSINATAMGGPANNVSIDVAIKIASDITGNSVVQGITPQMPSMQAGYYDINHIAVVTYDHFETNLKHDPEFGFGEGPGNSYIWIIIIVVVVIAIIVIILIAVIGFILVRRRRRSYDAF